MVFSNVVIFDLLIYSDDNFPISQQYICTNYYFLSYILMCFLEKQIDFKIVPFVEFSARRKKECAHVLTVDLF